MKDWLPIWLQFLTITNNNAFCLLHTFLNKDLNNFLYNHSVVVSVFHSCDWLWSGCSVFFLVLHFSVYIGAEWKCTDGNNSLLG